MAAALAAADVFLAPTTKSLSHTRAQGGERRARGATLPGVTADLLARLMAVDLETLQQRSRTLAKLLDRAATPAAAATR